MGSASCPKVQHSHTERSQTGCIARGGCSGGERYGRLWGSDLHTSGMEHSISIHSPRAQLQQLSTSTRYGESRVAYREVQDRHHDIQKIERTLEELAQLFNDVRLPSARHSPDATTQRVSSSRCLSWWHNRMKPLTSSRRQALMWRLTPVLGTCLCLRIPSFRTKPFSSAGCRRLRRPWSTHGPHGASAGSASASSFSSLSFSQSSLVSSSAPRRTNTTYAILNIRVGKAPVAHCFHLVILIITTWTILMHETLSYTASPGSSLRHCCSRSSILGVMFLLLDDDTTYFLVVLCLPARMPCLTQYTTCHTTL